MPECRHRPMAFIRGKNKVARNEKWKKQLWVFVYNYIKYGKFWSVSPKVISSSKNSLFLMSDKVTIHCRKKIESSCIWRKIKYAWLNSEPISDGFSARNGLLSATFFNIFVVLLVLVMCRAPGSARARPGPGPCSTFFGLSGLDFFGRA